MDTSFPEGETASLKLTLARPKSLTLSLRRPSWAGAGFSIKINGQLVKNVSKPGSYIELKRSWKNNDTISLILPKVLHKEGLPDNPNRVALMWGPLVLAGDMGQEGREGVTPVFAAASKPVPEWIKPVANQTGSFKTVGVGRDTVQIGREKEVDLVPFYRLHNRTYSAYFDLYSDQEWQRKAAEISAQQEKQRRLEAATVSFAQPGQMQPERDYNQLGEETEPARVMGRTGRRGKKWFSFDMPVDTTHPMKLILTFNSDEWRNRTFDVLIDGQKLAEQTVERKLPGAFYDVEFPLLPAMIEGKKKVTVRFQATKGNEIAAIYGIRMIRSDAVL
jgi:hypothetical protein